MKREGEAGKERKGCWGECSVKNQIKCLNFHGLKNQEKVEVSKKGGEKK